MWLHFIEFFMPSTTFSRASNTNMFDMRGKVARGTKLSKTHAHIVDHFFEIMNE